MTINLAALKHPFSANQIEWRIGQAGKKGDGSPWAKVLAYITNRAVMDRLDEVCGPENWKNEYKEWRVGDKHGVLCGISIRINGEWVTKWDGAENTDIESIKGGISDSMKRAAVQWGIGRYLYDLDEGWARISDNGKHYAHCRVKFKGKDEFVDFRWDEPQLPAWALPSGEAPSAPSNGSSRSSAANSSAPPKSKKPDPEKIDHDLVKAMTETIHRLRDPNEVAAKLATVENDKVATPETKDRIRGVLRSHWEVLIGERIQSANGLDLAKGSELAQTIAKNPLSVGEEALARLRGLWASRLQELSEPAAA